MIRLMAEKVQKVSERVGFPSGNIQIDPVKSCGKNTDHQRKDKAEYLSSNDRIQGISRKKCCRNITGYRTHRRNCNTSDHRNCKIPSQSFPRKPLTALQIFSHNSVSLRYRRRRLIQASAPSFFTSDKSYSHISHLFSLQD